MACQNVCKQGKDDVMVKVNLQSPIPTSFYITVANWREKDVGIGLCKFIFTINIIPTLFALPFLHLFTFLMFLKSCYIRYVLLELL